MGDLAALITAVSALITAAGGAWALVVNTRRVGRREPRAAAENAARRVAAELAAAAADGEITPEEIAAALAHLREEDQA